MIRIVFSAGRRVFGQVAIDRIAAQIVPLKKRFS
jgi:hypothetical protein